MVDNSRSEGPQLITLPPPNPPTDLIASALFLPLNAITSAHRGRKLRFVGQVLAFHPPTSLLLLTSYPPTNKPHTPSPTILINISIPLLGQNPSGIDVSSSADSMYSKDPQIPSPTNITDFGSSPKLVNRESLSLNRGEWVNIVGWLEGEGEKMVRKVKTSSSYLKPLPIILECIHISNSRPPPIDAMYRGNMESWDGNRSVLGDGTVEFSDHVDEEEIDFEIIETPTTAKVKQRRHG
ncbi:uncharacterized protein L201_006521 [Kwoniella dendrophila CBS 6074]|uniref:Uncharacterized protein n=1 Tax=Kwoniella dendrophila CBS 6074 TaxID=1295534 RepID=A0AAX4K452_9TREE